MNLENVMKSPAFDATGLKAKILETFTFRASNANAPAKPDLEDLIWPWSRLGEGLAELARVSGLSGSTPARLAVPDELGLNASVETSRWISWASEQLGLEAKEVEATPASLDGFIAKAGPALIRLAGRGKAPGFLLLLKAKGQKARLIAPDLSVRSVVPSVLIDAIAQPLEAPLYRDVDRLLDAAGIEGARKSRIRTTLARQRLANSRIGGLWTLDLAPNASFVRQLLGLGFVRSVATILILLTILQVLEITGWGMIGNAAMNGRLDFGWLVAWALMMLSIIPLRLMQSFVASRLAIGVSRLFKSRLLTGGLQMDIQAMRREGAGHLLGRVMESQAFESLVVNGGIGALAAIIELVFAAMLLLAGAGGVFHLALMMVWAGIAAFLGWRNFRALSTWTDSRLSMTRSLVERMIGHRTILAQENPDRRNLILDHEMKDYVATSRAMDRTVTPFMVGIPAGWMVVGLIGLAPAFISGSATPESLAIGFGAIILAGRALSGFADALAGTARAAIAWEQIGPLFTAGGIQRPVSAFVPKRHDDDPGPGRLVDAEGLVFRYGTLQDPVLKNTKLSIAAGERLLLEGKSGGGKSTLASILVGLRKPQAGLLLLNGLDRHTLGDNWHSLVTEAPQFHENHILSGTLGFNLLMGRAWPASPDDLAEARAICDELGLGELIERMPSGMMQTIGETGWQLSHGEKSRIFLARALLQGADLTILDESFAALDPQTLKLCLDCAFKRARTLMVIAHP